MSSKLSSQCQGRWLQTADTCPPSTCFPSTSSWACHLVPCFATPCVHPPFPSIFQETLKCYGKSLYECMLENVPVTISALQINLKFVHLQTTILLFSWMFWLGIHRQSGHVLFRLHHVWSLIWEDSKAGSWNHLKAHLLTHLVPGLGRLTEQSCHLDNLPTIHHEAWLPHICSLWVVRLLPR